MSNQLQEKKEWNKKLVARVVNFGRSNDPTYNHCFRVFNHVIDLSI